MLDLDKDEYRHVFAELTILRILVSSAWETIVADWPEEDRKAGLDTLLRLGSTLEHKAAADDAAEAEAAADITVIAQERLRTILERIAKRTGTDWTPPADDLLSGILRRS